MNSGKYKFLIAHLIIFLVLIIPVVSFAQPNPNPPPSQPTNIQINIPNPLKNNTTDLMGLLDLIIKNAILPIGGIVAAIMIIYAGFMYVTAQGNVTKIQTANRALLYAAIGTAVLLGARVLSSAIQGTVNQISG